jgi:ferritin-like metal-binding protein YciE
MKLVIEKIADLQALYERQLRLLLSAEEISAIKYYLFVDSAIDPELHQVLQEHQRESETHSARLRDILARITGAADPLKCRVIYALFDEAEDLLKSMSHESVRNALLIGAAQRIKHYEIGAYGSLRQFAKVMGHDNDAHILEQSLREEEESDRRLTSISERINPLAKKAA